MTGLHKLIEMGRDRKLSYEERFLTRLELADALEAALEGLYRVYVNLGEDTDGARNAEELFGPWVGFDPATHIPNLVAEHRDEWEHAYEEGVQDAKRDLEMGAYYDRHGR